MVSLSPKPIGHITRFPRWNNMRVKTRRTLELSDVVDVVDVDVDVEVGVNVTVTLDTAVVVGFALVDEGEGPRDPDGFTLPRSTYPYTPSPPQTSLGHAGQGVSHFELLSCTDLTGA
jgi:hypothetical protein